MVIGRFFQRLFGKPPEFCAVDYIFLFLHFQPSCAKSTSPDHAQ
jgi:hypothetical protein